jgi:hypothetical protein
MSLFIFSQLDFTIFNKNNSRSMSAFNILLAVYSIYICIWYMTLGHLIPSCVTQGGI